jgi:hypothetical protein
MQVMEDVVELLEQATCSLFYCLPFSLGVGYFLNITIFFTIFIFHFYHEVSTYISRKYEYLLLVLGNFNMSLDKWNRAVYIRERKNIVCMTFTFTKSLIFFIKVICMQFWSDWCSRLRTQKEVLENVNAQSSKFRGLTNCCPLPFVGNDVTAPRRWFTSVNIVR